MSEQLELFGGPTDAPARDFIRTALDTTVFVEAGAGTGKTAMLVDRIVALVTGTSTELPVPMPNIAAITFTEKAAAELRDRVRRELQAQGRADAVDQLDEAAICTLHSFAQRILTDFPIESGLPPRIEVRDEISSRVAFESRWRLLVDALLETPVLEPAILTMLASGIRLEHLRAVAEMLDDNWDLLDRVGAPPPIPPLAIDAWLADLQAVCRRAAECRDPNDLLVARLEQLDAYGSQLTAAFDDIEQIRLLRADKPSFRVNNCGRSGNWPDIAEVRATIVKLGADRDAMIGRVLDAAIRHAIAALARATIAAVGDRRAAGELEFHDLLVLARALLRDPAHGGRARARLRERYQRILIDEFQDTDPIQVELAALLATPVEHDDAPETRPWSSLPVEPGRVFFVGDPKQSIYRFRRADIATFLEAADRFADHAPQFLSCNFRTAANVLDWINAVFAELIRAHPGSQPEYRALDAGRADGGDGRVTLLGRHAHSDKPNADELRAREAADVAGAVQRVMKEQWQVFDRDDNRWRAAQLGDVCILLPARTSLGFLERAFDDAGIAYRAESSSLVYATREVRDLLAALRAIDDPSDELSLVSALRSALFGCGDDDLFVYHVEHGGRWDLRMPVPDSLPSDNPVRGAMARLRVLHDRRLWSTPSELLECLVREQRVLEAGALGTRFRDIARRVRFLIDQARAFSDTQSGTLRDYLAWAAMQSAEGARVVEAVLPETDDDAVRILTIHSAKGLEFPIVICSGATTAALGAQRGVQVLFPPAGGCEVKLAKGVQTAHFELYQPVDEQMDFHEKLRLLYVACTRARDHLIVSVHRRERDLDRVEPTRWTHAELVWNACRDIDSAEAFDVARVQPVRRAPAAALAAGLAPAVWEEEYERLFASGSRRAFVSATALAKRDAPPDTIDPGLAKEARDLELPPWNKGRYGTAIGRAVHGTLQTIDLLTGADVDATAAAQAAAEGVLGFEATIAALTRAALGAPSIQRAAQRPSWRETYVAVPLEGLTLEGYVDVVYRDDDGLVVVDYKTDAVTNIADAATMLARYQLQVGAYAVAIELATGEPVVRAVLVFLQPGGAREVVIEGDALSAASAEARTRAAAELRDPSPLPPATLVDA
jgi:ATP-dependent exoDNAse (exonuclease V) beta subunit